MYSYQILKIRKSRGLYCSRLDPQRINPKKCTLNKFWKLGRAAADFVVGWTFRESIQRNVLLSNFENGKSRGQFRRRLDHQRINPKKCTLIKFWKSGRAEADFVVGWNIRESIQRNVMYSYQILKIRKSRGWFCRWLDHQRVNPKKYTLIKFWKLGRAEANFVVG